MNKSRLLVVPALLGLMSIAAPAAAEVRAWLLADKPTTADYIPNADYQYSSENQPGKVVRSGVGTYSVVFKGQGANSNPNAVHVTAYGGNHTCQLMNWLSFGAEVIANVKCYKIPQGTLVDGKFTAFFYKEDGVFNHDAAHLWADKPTSSSYTPNMAYQWSSAGLANTVTRSAVGTYKAKLPGMGSGRLGTVMVTAHGTAAARCKVSNWNLATAENTAYVGVNCFNSAGAKTDNRFVLTYTKDTHLGDDGDDYFGAYVGATNPTLSSYTPVSSHRYASPTGTAQPDKITRLAIGSYRVHLPAMHNLFASEIAVAYGTDSNYCTIKSWADDDFSDHTTGTNANVTCWNSTGAAADSKFLLQHITSDIIIIPL